MRFVPTHCLRPGMILADNLYGRTGAVLLTKGTVLNDKYLNSIFRLQYNGVYIDDDFSKDIDIINVIDENLRMQAVRGIKNIFINTKENQKGISQNIDDLEDVISSIVDEILGNQNLVVNMVDIKVFDDYTYYHSVNVAVLSIVLGVALQLTRKELHDLCMGALLHDIGKVFIQKDILTKSGNLSDDEITEVRQHPLAGCEYITKSFRLPHTVTTAIMDHHEKCDGSGYPEGRSSRNISLFGKIIALADVYDALTSDRPYRKAMLPSEAVELIMGSVGTHFEPYLVNTFLRKIAPYPIGTLVELSNGYTGIVLENHEDFCLRPIVKVLQSDGQEITSFMLDLIEEDLSNVTIVGIA